MYNFVFTDNYKDMLVSGIDTDTYKVTNKLGYIDGVSVKKSKYTEISKIRLEFESAEKDLPAPGDIIQYRTDAEGFVEKWQPLCN